MEEEEEDKKDEEEEQEPEPKISKMGGSDNPVFLAFSC